MPSKPRPAPIVWALHERPTIPGSAPTPDHHPRLRVAYGLIGLLVGLTGGLGNALVSVNLATFQGALGLSPVEAAWIPIVFTMTSVCASILLFKVRQQFGLRLFAELGLSVYVLLMIGDLFAQSYGSTLLVRAASGFVGSCLTSMGILYMLQAFPAAHRIKAIIIGMGLSTLAIPLARLFSSDLIQVAEWRGLHIFELGLALLSLGAVTILKLPPSDKFKAFEGLDLVSFGLFAGGMALLCAALGLGRVVWWTEAAWIGWALCGALILIVSAFVIEHNRKNPLLQTRWMGSADILRLALVSILVRVILSEQTVGAVGLMTVEGIGSDQLRGLFAIILIATITGSAVSALTMNPANLGPPLLAALALMAIGAFMDSDASNLTRPENLYLSQAILAFAASLFLAPALLFGIARAMAQGPSYIISFVAVFSGAQTLGGLMGSALIGTAQVAREKFHSSQLVERLNPADPLVAQRLQQLGGAYARTQPDAALRQAEGGALLGQQATREANILAYNDVFLAISVIAALTFLWIGFLYLRARLRTRREALALQRANPASGNL
ncbi:MAG: MFS transporter [Caulobacteraceae bacterium]|nr:MAG: MFS transporter [Caulobacteraceae bacterium]